MSSSLALLPMVSASSAIFLFKKDFFIKNPLINLKVFLGDAAFNTVALYKALLTDSTFGHNRHFSKAYISLNARSHLENVDYTINENGIPCCPHDASIPMKPEESKSNLRSGLPTFKFVCPKMSWVYNTDTRRSFRQCNCVNPCASSKCGRMVYIYPEKISVLIPVSSMEARNGTILTKYEPPSNETSITQKNLCLADRRTRNEKTLHADLLLAGITQLITVVLADNIHHHEYIRSLKPLII